MGEGASGKLVLSRPDGREMEAEGWPQEDSWGGALHTRGGDCSPGGRVKSVWGSKVKIGEHRARDLFLEICCHREIEREEGQERVVQGAGFQTEKEMDSGLEFQGEADGIVP